MRASRRQRTSGEDEAGASTQAKVEFGGSKFVLSIFRRDQLRERSDLTIISSARSVGLLACLCFFRFSLFLLAFYLPRLSFSH